MHTIALFGAGKIGEAIVALLLQSKQYKVRICDVDGERAKAIALQYSGCTGHALDLKDEKASLSLLKGAEAVLCALPFYCNVRVAKLAAKAKVHYLDLTEDINTTSKVIKIGNQAQTAFIPQCGLAPGFISIAASHLLQSFDELDTVKLRVGALPIYPSNKLQYNLTWSTEGLINEYCNRCEVIENSLKQTSAPLEGYETISLDGDGYEAFNTSGGLGSLVHTLDGKVRKLNYKSIRYKGHRDYIDFLLNDLRFYDDRETLIKVLERSISTTAQDKCLIFVEVKGYIASRLVQKTYASTVYNTHLGKRHFGAIQITTASGICTPLDLLLSGKLKKKKGIIKCEDIPLPLFLDNRFGKYYKDEKALSGAET